MSAICRARIPDHVGQPFVKAWCCTTRCSASKPQVAHMANLATFKPPAVQNEPNVRLILYFFYFVVLRLALELNFSLTIFFFQQKHYVKGSPDRQKLVNAVAAFKKAAPVNVPVIVGGKPMKTSNVQTQANPSAHATSAASFYAAGPKEIKKATTSALAAKSSWENLPFADRASIFLKAADLVSSKYRYELMAASMVGQGKNAWQAEIDAAAELCDFLRFNVHYASELYAQQPVHNATGVWNRVEYRPLEGFVYAVSPFNFTAIGGNLPAAPALMGNVVIWKPSPYAIASNYLVYRVLEEAGLPAGVIQFVPGNAEEITHVILNDSHFSALHYTGSTAVFRSLYGKIAQGIADGKYHSYPRIVGETGGKNFHLIHHSADIRNAVINTIRGAFEFQGQKCSACSRAYVPSSVWDEFKSGLVDEVNRLKIGDPEDFTNFIGPVIHEASFNKLSKAIDEANRDKSLTLICGGKYDKSKGYFIHPTVYATTNPSHPLLHTELFGPIMCILVYNNGEKSHSDAFRNICKTIDSTGPYGLTGAVFAKDREAILHAENALRWAAGNFYINCKCTGAVVGQQPFGGARASGTNDKAGSSSLLSRFVSMRAIKEEFLPTESVLYPSNQ
ncbi:1-pyrroline-5-carboxylate dehydrogenase [Myotisia sp. PD_48]|nr:1-pyrroline-5-carboxylate dehydrogenase [Myotisia sp. PD_48]